MSNETWRALAILVDSFLDNLIIQLTPYGNMDDFSVEINAYGVGIKLNNVRGLLNMLKQQRDKKQVEICLTLELTLSNIEAWYLHFVRIFSPEIARQINRKSLEETPQISDEVIRFIDRNEAIHVSEDCQDYLRKIKDDYIYNRLKKSIADKIEPERLGSLDHNIMFFRVLAVDVKKDWLRKSIEAGRWDVSAGAIQKTIDDLGMYLEEVRRLVRSLQMDLECDRQETRNFYQQLRIRA